MAERGQKKGRLEMLFFQSDLSFGEIADKAGVDPKTIYELRRRKYVRQPRKDVIEKVAKVLGCTPEKLLAYVMGRRAKRGSDEPDGEPAPVDVETVETT